MHLFLLLSISLSVGSLAFQISPSFSRPTTATFARAKSKWDDLVDEDEDEYESIPVAQDMIYEPANLIRQHQHFHDIRGAGGQNMTNDVYVREPEALVFWYIGKVARVTEVSLEQTVARQWHMIERHAGNIRPIELRPHRGTLEIWTAPGDSEMLVAYNNPSCKFQKMNRQVDGASKVRSNIIGFQGEVYEKGEAGFRAWRTEEGLPDRPEINPEGASRPPTAEELAKVVQQGLQAEHDKDEEA